MYGIFLKIENLLKFSELMRLANRIIPRKANARTVN